jgi:leucyl aminopeptidase
MKITLSTDAPEKIKADVLAIGIPQGGLTTDATFTQLDGAAGGLLTQQATLDGFEGKKGELLRVTVSGLGVKAVLVIGLGEGASPSVATLRLMGSTAGQAAASYGSMALFPPAEDAESLRAVVSGAVLGAYRYTRYFTGDRRPKKTLGAIKVRVGARRAAERKAVKAGQTLAECVMQARDLVNDPPNDLNPVTLAEWAKAEAKAHGVTCRVWDKKAIARAGMNLFLAVNAGSAIEPRMIHLTYKPKGRGKHKKVAFVGKGLTFDAGGLCLKPPKSMLDMKCDMGGAAITLGIVFAAARLGLNVEVHGLIGSTENMLGAAAYRPSDVYTSHFGKSVEIINTDAEGRLVLADVLSHTRKLNADFVIDHATLTGACMVALGPYRAGLFTDDEELAERYASAAEVEGESYWRLPLDEDLKDMLRSEVADLKHTGDRAGGAITAALFLQNFVGEDTRWMHLDVAGPTMLDRPKGVMPKGGTGFGVMTGVRFLESLSQG